ncbi:MAG: PAS domain-containing sensor histidine kinase, partial [Nocardioidaceae bacterium]|nr:PAS domain-containing sensor histidine kinase [Nocardioidaceae bacterium]
KEGTVAREDDPQWSAAVPVRAEAIPVRHQGRVIAVISRNTDLLGVRTPSLLEINYLQAASELGSMIATGRFPSPGQRSDHADSPRVGDGFLRVDADGRVVYASPNGLSVFRKLGLAGDLTGHRLTELTRELVPPRWRPDEETLSAVLGGRAHRDTELGSSGTPGDGVSLIMRAIPLRPEGEHIGAIILVRDVTDIRRRDRELITKDATIREIHHRVKNNLQTVAALLRLQARRIDSAEAAGALEEAVRRVGSIAIVHEILSQAVEETVAFDDIADRLARLVTDVGSTTGQVGVSRQGSFGALPSEIATPLAMVLMELMQNAAEHGYQGGAIGKIVLSAERGSEGLEITVTDDGSGLPAGFDLDATTSLGLSIVRTLVVSELGGQLSLGHAPGGGTRAGINLPLE